MDTLCSESIWITMHSEGEFVVLLTVDVIAWRCSQDRRHHQDVKVVLYLQHLRHILAQLPPLLQLLVTMFIMHQRTWYFDISLSSASCTLLLMLMLLLLLLSPVSIHLLIHLSTHRCHHPHSQLSAFISLQAQNVPFQHILPTLTHWTAFTIMWLDRTYHAHQFIFSFRFVQQTIVMFLMTPWGLDLTCDSSWTDVSRLLTLTDWLTFGSLSDDVSNQQLNVVQLSVVASRWFSLSWLSSHLLRSF